SRCAAANLLLLRGCLEWVWDIIGDLFGPVLGAIELALPLLLPLPLLVEILLALLELVIALGQPTSSELSRRFLGLGGVPGWPEVRRDSPKIVQWRNSVAWWRLMLLGIFSSPSNHKAQQVSFHESGNEDRSGRSSFGGLWPIRERVDGPR